MQKIVYTIQDIMEITGLGKSKASEIMRAAKAFNDNLGISGVILISDFNRFYNITPQTATVILRVVPRAVGQGR